METIEKKPEINIKIKATNVELTEPTESYVRTKIEMLQKLLSHYAERKGKLLFEVEVGKTTKHHEKGDVFRAEINVSVGGAFLLRSEAVHHDLHSAIDTAKDEMRRELLKNKEKDLKRGRKDGEAFKRDMRKD